MVESIDISDFRGIRECKSPLELSEFTVLVGRNNSGKSSVLEALYCLHPGSDDLFGYRRHNFVTRLHSRKRLAHRYSGNATLEYTHAGSEGLTKVGSAISQRPGVSDFDGDTILYPSTDQHIDRAYDKLQQQRAGIEEDEAHIRVAEFLNQSIGDDYTEIYLETLEARKSPEDANPYWVDIKDLGSGLVKTIPIFLAIEHFEPSMFLWDDMGTSLHPGLLKRVIEWLSESDTQIVTATHSIDVLSSLLEVRPYDTSVLQLSKSADDVLDHTKIDLKELELMMDTAGHDPRYLAEAMEI